MRLPLQLQNRFVAHAMMESFRRINFMIRQDKIATVVVVLLVVTATSLSFFVFPNLGATYTEERPILAKLPKAADEDIAVSLPPFSENIFPCSDCHSDMKTNPERRKLTEAHTDIVFEHDAQHRWCLDCHNANDRDKLHLANGTLVDFKESYTLCGQCHGDKLRDWKVGVHGKRMGYWNGKKTYLLCVHCHNPHSPHFKPLKPLSPPVQPNKPQILSH